GGDDLGEAHRQGEQGGQHQRADQPPGLPPQGAAADDGQEAGRRQDEEQQIQHRQQGGGKGVGAVGPEEKQNELLIGGEDQAGQPGDGIAAAGVAHAQIVQQFQAL